jgi:CheY-like chemotaxis protein
MGEEIRRRLFEPFFTTKGPDHGTGMGLAAVYGTIRNHHGAIQVDSARGRGSVFSVLLPLADGRRAAKPDSAAEAPAGGQGHVLVADDQPIVLQVTAQMLAELGYRVTTRPDGAAALSFYRDAWREIDLVLLNVMMPAMSGPAALLEMRRINPAVPAVLCSGHPLGPGDEDIVGEAGIRFLEKPFTLRDLARCVAAVLPTDGSAG